MAPGADLVLASSLVVPQDVLVWRSVRAPNPRKGVRGSKGVILIYERGMGTLGDLPPAYQNRPLAPFFCLNQITQAPHVSIVNQIDPFDSVHLRGTAHG